MNVKFHKITSYTWNFQNFTCDANHNSIDSTKRDLTRAVTSVGQGGQLLPRTYWARHIKSLDGFVFFRLSYFDYSDLQLFAIFIFEVDFSETYLMTSAENSVSEPPNLTVFWGRYPPTPLQGSWLKHLQ